MKAVHELESAQMLLLITDTSQSNSLLMGKSGTGETALPGRVLHARRPCVLSLPGQRLNPLDSGLCSLDILQRQALHIYISRYTKT